MSTWEIRQGDVLDRLRDMPDGSVHCCITSPPYFGLRDYQTGKWEGGDPECDHVRRDMSMQANLALSSASAKGGAASRSEDEPLRYGSLCGRCGAKRTDNQVGLEPTPDEYVAKLVEVFREVKRVLRDDGTLWLNLGDSYAGSGGVAGGDVQGHGGDVGSRASWAKGAGKGIGDKRHNPVGAKPKDLWGIPWMVAFALRADGWYLRSEVIWAKPNPMPESVTDRPTKAHEQVFLLSKSARYFYDADAIREPHVRLWDQSNGGSLAGGDRLTRAGRNDGGRDALPDPNPLGRNKRSVWTVATQPYPDAHFATFPPKLIEPMVLAGSPAKCCGACGAPWQRETRREIAPDCEGRVRPEKRDDDRDTGLAPHGGTRASWSVRTTGWRPTCSCGAPEGLGPDDLDVIESPTGDEREDDPSMVVGRAGMSRPRSDAEGRTAMTRWQQRQIAAQIAASPHRPAMEVEAGSAFEHYVRRDRTGARPPRPFLLNLWVERGWITVEPTPAWEPPESGRAMVLDPFAGSGTTLQVALDRGRSAIGIELNPDYVELAERRLSTVTPPLFAEAE